MRGGNRLFYFIDKRKWEGPLVTLRYIIEQGLSDGLLFECCWNILADYTFVARTLRTDLIELLDRSTSKPSNSVEQTPAPFPTHYNNPYTNLRQRADCLTAPRQPKSNTDYEKYKGVTRYIARMLRYPKKKHCPLARSIVTTWLIMLATV